MTEQRNWTGLGFNPAPGDQGVVGGLSSSLRQVAGHLISVHATLTRIANGQDEWTGQAAKAFGNHLGKLPGYLQDASDSITEAYQELDKWYQSLAASRSPSPSATPNPLPRHARRPRWACSACPAAGRW
ncbi:putative T7SS-secreted protein [Kitasatospora acidiphila]|uniref:putative T7SS-secreted protein n=1 Tax=Kitasatospora acidiphila TaxID=2567942 RepID=UPI002B4003FB|nr:hypothetical protein [Kitasatospora acidiphila]